MLRYFSKVDFIDSLSKNHAIIVLMVWFFCQVVISFSPAYVPDEGWFLLHAYQSAGIVENGNQSRLCIHPNDFGYGGIFWSFYTLLVIGIQGLMGISASEIDKISHLNEHAVKSVLHYVLTDIQFTPLYALRSIVWSVFFWFGLTMIRNARSGTMALIGTLSLVFLPLAWWSGKIGSPELISAILFGFAVYFSFIRNRPSLGTLITALAVGIKLTVAPIALVLLSFNHLFSKNSLNLKAIISALGIFIICNPWLLKDPRSGLETVIALSSAHHPLPSMVDHAWNVLTGATPTWDGTNYGSLLYWSGSFAFIIFGLFAAWVTNTKFFLFLATGGAVQFIFMMTQPIHNWYLFPFIIALVIPYYFAEIKYLGFFIFGIVSIVSSSGFENELKSKRLHLIEIDSLQTRETILCISEKVRSINPRHVYDLSSIGYLPSASIAHDVLNYHDAWHHFATGGSLEQDSVVLVGRKSLIYQPFIWQFKNNSYESKSCGEISIIQNKRA